MCIRLILSISLKQNYSNINNILLNFIFIIYAIFSRVDSVLINIGGYYMTAESLSLELNLKSDAKSSVFARGLSRYKLSLIFIVGSIIGTWYEEIMFYMKHGGYESRSGVMYGPFNPLYGLGILLMVLALNRIRKWYHCITYGAILGGTLEYFSSLLQELFTGSVSWDYSQKLTNIDGRTTVLYAVFWGVLGLVIAKVIYPYLSKGIEKIPVTFGKIMTISIVGMLIINMFISYSALIRQGLRARGYDPITPLGEFYDQYYTDSRISELFPNMSLVIENQNETNNLPNEETETSDNID